MILTTTLTAIVCLSAPTGVLAADDRSAENSSSSSSGGVRPSDPLPTPGLWTHYGRTPERRPLALGADPGPASLSDVAWTATHDQLGRELEFTGPVGVVADKQRVFTSARIDGAFHAIAIDRVTGDVLWTTPLDHPAGESWASPAIDLGNGTVLYPALDALVALERATGQIVWSAPAQSLLINASPVVTNDLGPADRAFIVNYGQLTPPGRLICVNVDPYDSALNPYQPGEIVWTRFLSQPTGGASPAYRDGVVYIATSGIFQLTSGTIEAYDATSTSAPAPLWSVTAPGLPGEQGFYGGVALSQGFAYAATYEFFGDQLSARLVKVDTLSGQLVWSAPCNRTSSVPIILGDGRVALSTGLFPDGQTDFGSRPSVQLFRDHGSFGELLWDSAFDTWTDTNQNGALDTGEYLAIGGWSHLPALRVCPGQRLLYVGTVAQDSLATPEFQPYDEMRVIDLGKLPSDPGFVVDSASGYGSTPAIVGDALFSVGPQGLTRVGTPTATTRPVESRLPPERLLESLRRRYVHPGNSKGDR